LAAAIYPAVLAGHRALCSTAHPPRPSSCRCMVTAPVIYMTHVENLTPGQRLRPVSKVAALVGKSSRERSAFEGCILRRRAAAQSGTSWRCDDKARALGCRGAHRDPDLGPSWLDTSGGVKSAPCRLARPLAWAHCSLWVRRQGWSRARINLKVVAGLPDPSRGVPL
jgi:hypothetical protein